MDRENVISTFEKIISVCKKDGCDFVDLTFEDAEQILALLKEQEEPHILTIKELWNVEVVWLEWRDKAQVKVALPFIDAQDETYLFNGTVGNFEEIPFWYKHTWVAWSARPTEENRRKVKWE